MRQVTFLCGLMLTILGCEAGGKNWYEKSFYLLHEDHHTHDRDEVGRDADPEKTAQLVALSKPDVVQIHAKGNPGWTTYPTKIGYTPPQLARDVLGVWRDMARNDGYVFSVYYNIGRDGVIMERRPAWNRMNANGTPVDKALCYHSGVAEEYLWPMIREIMEQYEPDGLWFDGSCFTVRVCYCEKCRQRYKSEQGLDAPKGPTQPGWRAYQEMQRQIYREFVRDTSAMIHKIDPDCLVAFNWAYSLRMPEKPDAGIAYLSGDIGHGVEALSAEGHWYDSLDVPFDLMTTIHTLYVNKKPDGTPRGKRMGPKPCGQIEQEMAVIIANGGRYFAWDNPTPESGLIPERLEFLGEVVAPFLRARQKWCLGSKRIPDVSLLNNAASHYAVIDNSAAVFSKKNNRILGAANTLPRLHLNYEMVPDWRLEAQDIRSPLLIVEHPKMLADATIESLIEYVRGGGSLLMTGMGAACDERIRQMCGIAECAATKRPEQLVAKNAGADTAFNHWLHRVKLSTAKQLIGVTDSRGQTHPIMTKNSFGQGQAFYVAIPLLSQQGKNTLPAEFTQRVFDLALPPSGRYLTTNAPGSVETVLRRTEDAYVLHLVNLDAGQREVNKARHRMVNITHIPPVPTCHVSVRLPTRPLAVHLQPQGVQLEGWRYENGRLEADVPGFDIHQMVVMQVAR